jgi:uncharacterized damage-inducible protein DinB
MSKTIQTLMRYKAWADELTFSSVIDLPEGEASKKRKTNFGSITHTLNHVFVVDDIFRHHLEGQQHSYTSRNTADTPPLLELFQKQRAMNKWYLDLIERLSSDELLQTMNFEFVGGGNGAMTREEIFLHLVNHATYHRGFVNDMMYQVPARPPSNDLPVYLREISKSIST